MWGISRVTGMLNPEDLATPPISGEKQETTIDLSGRSRGSRDASNLPIIEPKYSLVPIFVEMYEMTLQIGYEMCDLAKYI